MSLPARHKLSMQHARRSRGFTLVEILVSTAIVLLLMGVMVTIFASVGENIRNSRTALEKNDQLRSAVLRLRKDLEGVTCSMTPPLRPEENQGYFEIVEGPIGPILSPAAISQYNPGNGIILDTSPIDWDDLLMLTTRSKAEPFSGRFSYKDFPNTSATPPETPDGTDANGDYKWRTTTMQSDTAEVCWFVRGTTLYRRVLLVRPDRLMDTDIRPDSAGNYPLDPLPLTTGFYGAYDLSVRVAGGPYDRDPGLQTQLPNGQIVPNTLGDLTKRENRFGHQPYVYPHDSRSWGALGLPTLRECSDPTWPFPVAFPIGAASGAGGGNSLYVQHDSHVYGPTDPLSKSIFPRSSSGSNQLLFAEEGTSGNNAYYGYAPYTQLELSGSIPECWADFAALTPRSTIDYYDAWQAPFPWTQTDRITGNLLEYNNGTRIAEDVILTNVIGFDVKVWDPYAPIMSDATTNVVYMPGDADYVAAVNGAGSTHALTGFGAYVDLNYMRANGDGDGDGLPDWPAALAGTNAALSLFRGAGGPFPFNDITVSGLRGCPPGTAIPVGAVYDTGSTSYERDGIDQDLDNVTDEYTDGYDNPVASGGPLTNNLPTGLGNNGIDDVSEQEAPPPYPTRLSGVQIKVRIFEPESQQVREVTLTHGFQDR
ncbi:MAG: type II secretion system protein J [Pirellulales bacterium]